MSLRLLLAGLLAAGLLVGLGGCATRSTASRSACCVEPAGPAAYSDRSVYLLDSTWTTDADRPLRLGELSGRVQVVTMFFASCQYACPVLVHDMQRIEAALSPRARAGAGFTLVSFDTVRDTPAALREFRQSRRLDSRRWTLLHGGADDVLELAALLGVKFKQDARGQFAHSNLITVLNARGEIIHQQIGLDADIAATVRSIEHEFQQP